MRKYFDNWTKVDWCDSAFLTIIGSLTYKPATRETRFTRPPTSNPRRHSSRHANPRSSDNAAPDRRLWPDSSRAVMRNERHYVYLAVRMRP